MAFTRKSGTRFIAGAAAGAAILASSSWARATVFTIPSNNPLTATMDSGTTAPSDPRVSSTWYQVGYNPSAPATGLPSNSVFTSQTNSNISYRTPSFASGNDALMLNGPNSGNVLTGTFTFASPVSAATANFSFLTSAGNSNNPLLTLSLNLVGGGTFAVTPTIVSPDWFDSTVTAVAYTANGRVSQTQFSNVNGNFPRLFDETVATGYSGSAQISGITISDTLLPGATNVAIFAVSGSTDGTTYSPILLDSSSFNQSIVATPEPLALGLWGVAGLGLLARRRGTSSRYT